VFDRVSVFAGPFTIEAAEAIVEGDGVDDWEVLDGLLALVDKSLVVADDAASDTRYRLLETMRQFGLANLRETETHERYRDRHADYYTEYVLSRRPRLQGAGDMRALDEIEAELENIRVALRVAADDASSTRFDAAFAAMFTLFQSRRASEGRSWAEPLTTQPGDDPRARIIALGFGATIAYQSDHALGDALARAAIEMSDATRAAPALMAISSMSIGQLRQGDTRAALSGCDLVLRRLAEEPDQFVRAVALSQTYAAFATSGTVEPLDRILRELTTLSEELDNDYLRGTVVNSRAPIIHVTDPDGAREYLRNGYEVNVRIRNYGGAHATLMFLALVELRSGDLVAAAMRARDSLELTRKHAPEYTAQTINAIVPIVRRSSPGDAAVLLGALRAHRRRVHLAGTETETEAEGRYEATLRRVLDSDFDRNYARGLELDDDAMLALAFAALDVITNAPGSAESHT
jgi:hypothetical protein